MSTFQERLASPRGRAVFQWLFVLTAFLLLALAGASWGTGSTPGVYSPGLGLYQLRVPAGVSYLSLPLAPLESQDPLEVFGPEILAATSLESWDAARAAWVPFYPRRPGALAGTQRLAGNVLRVTFPRAATLSIRGTPPTDTWQQRLARDLDAGLVGPTVQQPVRLREIVSAMEATSLFQLGRDGLEIWDLASGRWERISPSQLDTAIQPGSVIRALFPGAGGPRQTSTSRDEGTTGSVAPLERQTGVALEGAKGWKDKETDPGIQLSDFPTIPETLPELPYTIYQYSERLSNGNPVGAVGMMELPTGILAMTDLPTTVPVRIYFAREDGASVPARIDILGVSSFKVGGADDHVEVGANDDFVQLTCDADGVFYGTGSAELPAKIGRTATQRSEAATSTLETGITLYATEATLTETGATQDAAVFEIAIDGVEKARVFRRWTVAGLDEEGGSVTADLPDDAVEVAPGVFDSHNLWLQWSTEDVVRLHITGAATWDTNVLLASLGSEDGTALDAVDALHVTSASMHFKWMPTWADGMQLVEIDDNIATWHPTGLIELHLKPTGSDDRVSIQATDDDIIFNFHDPSDHFEFTFQPTINLASSTALKKTSSGDEEVSAITVTVQPVFAFRGLDFANSGNAYWEDLLVFFQPKVDLTFTATHAKELFVAIGTKLKALIDKWRTHSKTKAGDNNVVPAKSDKPAGQELMAEWRNLVSAFGFTGGAASVARFKGDSDEFNHRLSLWTTVSYNKTIETSTTEWAASGGGAYENLSEETDSLKVDLVSLSFMYASEQEGEDEAVETSQLSISAQLSPPEEWGTEFGWPADRKFTGEISLLHDADPNEGIITNRAVFHLTNLFAFKGKIEPVEWFDVGDGNTEFSLSADDLDVVFEAKEKEGKVKRKRTIDASLFAGTVAAGEDEDPFADEKAKGMRLSVSLERTSESTVTADSNDASAPSTSGLLALFKRQFSGPNPFKTPKSKPGARSLEEGKVTSATVNDLTLQFQNFGSEHIKPDFAQVTWETDEDNVKTWGVTLACSVRANSDFEFAAVEAGVEKSGTTWSFLANIDDFQLADEFSLANAYFRFDYDSAQGSKKWYQTLAVGGLVEGSVGQDIDQDGEADSEFAVGIDLDFDSKRASVYAELNGPVFCGGGDPKDCPMKSGILEGFAEFTSGYKPKTWALALIASFDPPWVDGAKPATASGRIAISPESKQFGVELVGFIPAWQFADTNDGSLQLTKLGVAYDFTQKAFSYEGTCVVTTPASWQDVAKEISLPQTVTAVVKGKNSAVTLAASLEPPVGFSLTEELGFQISNLTFTKASPWGLKLKAALLNGGKAFPVEGGYDTKTKLFTVAMDPEATIGFNLGSDTAFSVKGLVLKLGKSTVPKPSTRQGGNWTGSISGRTTIKFFGQTFVGDLTMSLDNAKNAFIFLRGAGGAPLFQTPEILGVSLAPSAIRISSQFDPRTQKRKTGLELQARMTLSEFPFGPLGGRSLEAAISYDAEGNLMLKTLSGLAPLRIKIPFTDIVTPFEIIVRQLEVTQNKRLKTTEISGLATLKIHRPLNSVFGSSGDSPFVVDVRFGTGKAGGKTVFFVEVVYTPPLKLSFRLLGADGSLIIPGIRVTSEGDLNLTVSLELRKPVRSTLTCIASVSQGKYKFDIFANPELRINIQPLFALHFKKLGYNQVFPGFMGVTADFRAQAGNNIFGMGVNFQELTYILPNVIPPFGFPFFERSTFSNALFGFNLQASASLPLPQVSLSDGLQLASGLKKAISHGDYRPLKNLLKSKLSGGDTSIFPGPHVGDIGFGFPGLLQPLFPFLSTTTWTSVTGDRFEVLELPIWKGMHGPMDFFPGAAAADAICLALELGLEIVQIFRDPTNIFKVIPEELRAQEIRVGIAGFPSLTAGWALKGPHVFTNNGSSGAIPIFENLGRLCDWIADEATSGIPDVARILVALTENTEPGPLKDYPFDFTTETGVQIAGTITDTFSVVRTNVQKALALAERITPFADNLDPDFGLLRHLKEIADSHGGAAIQTGTVLESTDGQVRIELFGQSPTIKVTVAEFEDGPIFQGTIPLAQTTTVVSDVGALTLASRIAVFDRQLTSDVTATFAPADGKPPRDLGTVSHSVLIEIDSPGYSTTPADGFINGWIAKHTIDPATQTQMSFSDFGNFRYVAPGKEITGLYRGSQFDEAKNLLRQLEAFRSIVYDYEASPYVLGLKVWSKLMSDPAVKPHVLSITPEGRTLKVMLNDPVTGNAHELRIVLEDLAYYMSSVTDPDDPSNVIGLSGSTNLTNFRVEGERLMAQPFSVSLGDASQQIRDLVIFDSNPAVRDLIDRSERQQSAMHETDLQQFARLGITVNGDPMIVRALRLEMDGPAMRVVMRPKDVKIVRRRDDVTLLSLPTAQDYVDAQKEGPRGDDATYPTRAGDFLVKSYNASKTVSRQTELYEALGGNAVIRTVTVTSPASLAGTFTQIAPGQLQGSISADGKRYQVGASRDGILAHVESDQGPLTLFRGRNGELEGNLVRRDASGNIQSQTLVTFQRNQNTGEATSAFKYPTGEKEEGGFYTHFFMKFGSASSFRVALGGVSIIRPPASFRFIGDLDVTILNFKVAQARYEYSNYDGVSITGRMDYYFLQIFYGGRFQNRPPRSIVSGAARLMVGGTGLDARMSSDTLGNPTHRVDGALKVAGSTIFTGKVNIGPGSMAVLVRFGGGSAGVNMDIRYNFNPRKVFELYVRLEAYLRVRIKIGFITINLGTIRIRFGPFFISNNGTFGLCAFGLLGVSVNIPRFRFGIRFLC